MILIRTPDGISNLYLFHKVDLVVFIEGGRDLSGTNGLKDDRLRPDSRDEKFWSIVFSYFLRGVKIKFQAVGSKNILKKYAEAILLGTKNACVAMDRDYDFSNRFDCPNVIYTRGYSWENDVCNAIALARAIKISIPFGIDINELLTEINMNLISILRDLRWIVRADYLLVCGGASLFDRRKPGGAYEHSRQGVKIRRDYLSTLFRQSRKTIGKFSPIEKIKTHPLNDCCGHVLMGVFCSIFNHLLKKRNLTTMPNLYIPPLLIDQCFAMINESAPAIADFHSHYREQVERVQYSN